MANLSVYQSNLGVQTLEEALALFLSTLAPTNRTHEFFVDWKKVRKNVENMKVELSILGSLSGSNHPAADLTALLKKYPEVAKVIPILVAVRELKFQVLEDLDAAKQYTDYNFSKPPKTPEEIEAIVRFCEKTGITELCMSLQTIRDYVTGVEVGSDTNARKNRSGTVMEELVKPLLHGVAGEIPGTKVIAQKTFKWLEKQTARAIPEGLRDRKFDIVVLTPNRAYNIETNFYGGGGSKPQEIVDSYINRQHELAASGWEFVWITDGYGWKTGTSQMRKAFKEMDYVLNVNFVKKGLLTTILTQVH